MIVAGILLGVGREFLVTRYFLAVSARQGLLGSALSLGIGLLDLFVIANMVMKMNLWMAVGYAFGEAAGTYLAVRLRSR